MNERPTLKRNVPGYIDEQGRFRPIRSPQFVGSGGSRRRATVKDKRKYSRAKAGDLGSARQERALEAPWDREYRLKQESEAARKREQERIMREIEGDIYGDAETASKGRTLMQFVRAQGGIRRTFRHGGKKSAGKYGSRSSWDSGEIDRLSFKETGKRGLTTDDQGRGKTLDKMYQAARQEGFDVTSIDDMMERIESEAAGGTATRSTHGSLSYNPGRKAATQKAKGKRQKVRILGQEVTVGTKKHADLIAQKKYFDDLLKSETGLGRSNPAGKSPAKNANNAKANPSTWLETQYVFVTGRVDNGAIHHYGNSIHFGTRAQVDRFAATHRPGWIVSKRNGRITGTKAVGDAAWLRMAKKYKVTLDSSGYTKLVKVNPKAKAQSPKAVAAKANPGRASYAGLSAAKIREWHNIDAAVWKSLSESERLALAHELKKRAALRAANLRAMKANPKAKGQSPKAAAAKANPGWRRLERGPDHVRIGCQAQYSSELKFPRKCNRRAVWHDNDFGNYYYCDEHAKAVKSKRRRRNPAKAEGQSPKAVAAKANPGRRTDWDLDLSKYKYHVIAGNTVSGSFVTLKQAKDYAALHPAWRVVKRSEWEAAKRRSNPAAKANPVKRSAKANPPYRVKQNGRHIDIFNRGGTRIERISFTTAAQAAKYLLQITRDGLVTSAGLVVKSNPDAVTIFAQAASGLLSAMQINNMLEQKSKKRKPRRKNPVKRSAVSGQRSAKANPAEVDEHAANELRLYADNDYQLYRSRIVPIHKNLITKKARGVYNKTLAVKLAMYLMDAAAIKYTKEFGSRGDKWNDLFNKPTRMAAAREFVEHFENEAAYGNYDSYLPAKYQKNPQSAIRNPRSKTAVARKSNIGGVISRSARKAKIKDETPAMFLMAFGVGSSTDGVYLSDGSALGKKFKTAKDAREYARAKGIKVSKNPIKRLPAKHAKAAKANPVRKSNGIVSRALARRKAGKYYRKEVSLERQLQKAREMRQKYEQEAKNNPLTAKQSKETNRLFIEWNAVLNRMKLEPYGSAKRKALQKKADAIWRKVESYEKYTVNPTKAKAQSPKANPVKPRSRTYEMFQGRKPTAAKPFVTSRHAPARLAQLGDLVEIKLAGRPAIKLNPGRVKLCAAHGRLWIAGQKFAKADPSQGANVINPIGEIDHVVYGTRKPHHGDHAYTHYIHKLGEESGRRPVLCVDRDGMPVIKGGNYTIEARGIVD